MRWVMSYAWTRWDECCHWLSYLSAGLWVNQKITELDVLACLLWSRPVPCSIGHIHYISRPWCSVMDNYIPHWSCPNSSCAVVCHIHHTALQYSSMWPLGCIWRMKGQPMSLMVLDSTTGILLAWVTDGSTGLFGYLMFFVPYLGPACMISVCIGWDWQEVPSHLGYVAGRYTMTYLILRC